MAQNVDKEEVIINFQGAFNFVFVPSNCAEYMNDIQVRVELEIRSIASL